MKFPNRDWIAAILAAAIFVAVLGSTIAIVYATVSNATREINTTASQLLTALFGGIIAILGAYVGGRDDKDKDDK